MRIDKDAQELSDQLGIKIFTADIIYHLFDNYTAHVKVSLITWLPSCVYGMLCVRITLRR